MERGTWYVELESRVIKKEMRTKGRQSVLMMILEMHVMYAYAYGFVCMLSPRLLKSRNCI
jgi:hypothetical protein